MISNPPPRNFSRPDYVPGAIERVLAKKGYIETVAGRRLRPGKWEAHKMLNKLIQGSAAEIMKRAIIRTAEHRRTAGWASHAILTVHDSLLYDVQNDELAALLEAVPKIMCDEPTINEVVPIVVEAKTGPRWSELEEVA
jgi:DNA polymerase-1